MNKQCSGLASTLLVHETYDGALQDEAGGGVMELAGKEEAGAPGRDDEAGGWREEDGDDDAASELSDDPAT